ncbi:hypothetical protein VP01_4403g2, partial [Puccinia sorghi]
YSLVSLASVKRLLTITSMSANPADENKPSQNTSSIKTTESSYTMEKIDLIYLKLAIDAIPTLTQDNFSLWHTQILHYLDRLSLNFFFVDSKGTISTNDAQNVQTLFFLYSIHPLVIIYPRLRIFCSHDFETVIDHSEKGLVRTSGTEALTIKGIGTIKISTNQGQLILNKPCIRWISSSV